MIEKIRISGRWAERMKEKCKEQFGMADLSLLGWTEVSPGVYERPSLDALRRQFPDALPEDS